MSLLKYVDRMKRMDDLIRRKATGTPDEFAERLGISKSMLMINLLELKQMGALLVYDAVNQTYSYLGGCRLRFEFELPTREMRKLNGGKGIYQNFSHSNSIRTEIKIFTMQAFES